jgi:Tol biopolymer transport system component
MGKHHRSNCTMQRRDLAHFQVVAKILVSRNSPRFLAFSMGTLPIRRYLWECIALNFWTSYVAIYMLTRSFCIAISALLLIACGSSTSHSDSSENAWTSLTDLPVHFLTSGNIDLWPCFSPDGSRIVFSRRTGESWELFEVPTSGGSPKPLTTSSLSVAATRANWSKQGPIAFTGTDSSGVNAIWTINSDGSSPRELHLNGLSNQMFYPSWSPDGTQIVAMDGQTMSLKRIELSKALVVTVTDPNQVFTGMPSVAPDGRSIVFAGQKNTGQRYDQSNNSIWVAEATGVLHVLESSAPQGRAPTWSPSGQQIAFESNRGDSGGQYAIFLIGRDGTGLIQVTNRELNADHPVWSPDGNRLAFSARSSQWMKGRGIAIVDIPSGLP